MIFVLNNKLLLLRLQLNKCLNRLYNMEKKRTTTEKEIVEAAKKLFLKNGYKSTTMRDIATEAGVNLAMLNYYFRSKENLFDIIFEEAVMYMSGNIITAISKSETASEMAIDFVNAHIGAIIKNPTIPGFIFQEVFINPKRLIYKVSTKRDVAKQLIRFQKLLKKDGENGIIRKIDDPINFMLSIISMCAFPFIAKPIIEEITGLTEEHYQILMTQRKKAVTDFIINTLRP